MDPDLQARVDRAKELLTTVRHVSMATVNADGSPHNTPLFFMYGDDLKHVFWGSHPDADHSKNIVRTGQIFMALYDDNAGGGLFIRAKNAHATEGEELKLALEAHNVARARFGKGDPLPLEYYQKGPQKMYMADVEKLWVNFAQRGADGRVVRDGRHEISAVDLLE